MSASCVTSASIYFISLSLSLHSLSLSLLLTPTHLSQELPTSREGQTQWFRVIFQNVLDAVVELGVHNLHITQRDLLGQKHLVEWSDEESWDEESVCQQEEGIEMVKWVG